MRNLPEYVAERIDRDLMHGSSFYRGTMGRLTQSQRVALLVFLFKAIQRELDI